MNDIIMVITKILDIDFGIIDDIGGADCDQ